MGKLINGRTPAEIKDGLRIHSTWGQCECCSYNKEKGTGAGHCIDRLTKDVYSLVEYLESERDAALAKVPKWISVKERLPEDCKDVLVWAVYHEEYGRNWALIEIDEHCKGVGWENTADPDVREVTHWMPLPSAPEGE